METAIRAGESTTLRAREAGYSAVRACLKSQSSATPRGRLAIFLGLSPLHQDARLAYNDAIGAFATAAQLDQLSDDWTVLNSVPLGSGESELDHIVIGPGGVFVLATRNYRGRKVRAGGNILAVDGHKTDEIRALRYAERRATDVLRQALGAHVPISPVIVVADCASLTIEAKAPAVPVLNLDRIPRWFHNRDRVLSATAVTRIVEVAQRDSTWNPVGEPLGDGLRCAQRFDRLRREVEAAHVRARQLALAGMGAAAIAVGSALAIMLPGIIGSVMAAVP
jgi:hypothetical protein